MPPENLPILENNPESDWWVFEKLSQNKTFQELANNRFLKPSATDKWWNLGLSSIVILILIFISLAFVYINSDAIARTFPNTIAVINKVNIVPELLTKIDFDLESRYSLSSVLTSLKIETENNPSTATPNTLIEKPVKIMIDKIGVNSVIVNPIENNFDVLNKSLELGAVRYPGSGLLGENKSIFIFGHSTSLATEHSYYKTFNNLDKLTTGDIVRVQSVDTEYTYKVTSVKITNTENALVEFDNNKKLVISTCNTIGQKEERIVVEADFVKSKLIKNETNPSPSSTPTTPTPIQTTAGNETYSTYEINNNSTGVISNPNGLIDFVATIDAIGILDSNNNFIATSTTQAKNKLAVKFTVKNIGTKKSEGWYFNAVLPTSPYHIFSSKSQLALAPGEKIEFTMAFDRPKIGENQLIVINVDPSNGIKESDKVNNITKGFITIVE